METGGSVLASVAQRPSSVTICLNTYIGKYLYCKSIKLCDVKRNVNDICCQTNLDSHDEHKSFCET